jgi:hypothetical protein
MSDTLDSGILLPFNFFSTCACPPYSKDSEFEYDESCAEPLKERAIWQAVIIQAISDATHAPINQKTRREKTQAIIWFSLTNKDFLFICELAGLDPKYLVRHVKKAIKTTAVIYRRKQHMKRLRNARFKQQADNLNIIRKFSTSSCNS